MLDKLPQLPAELQEELKAMPSELRARIDALPPAITAPPDPVMLLRHLVAVRLATAQDHFFDFGWGQLRYFAEQILDTVSGEVVRPGQIKRTAK